MARFAGVKVGPRITGTDYFFSLMKALQERGAANVFFFGSSRKRLELDIGEDAARISPVEAVRHPFSTVPPLVHRRERGDGGEHQRRRPGRAVGRNDRAQTGKVGRGEPPSASRTGDWLHRSRIRLLRWVSIRGRHNGCAHSGSNGCIDCSGSRAVCGDGTSSPHPSSWRWCFGGMCWVSVPNMLRSLDSRAAKDCTSETRCDHHKPHRMANLAVIALGLGVDTGRGYVGLRLFVRKPEVHGTACGHPWKSTATPISFPSSPSS